MEISKREYFKSSNMYLHQNEISMRTIVNILFLYDYREVNVKENGIMISL